MESIRDEPEPSETTMTTDIRDQAFISGSDVAGLNFIHLPDRYRFRRHYRQGLRSHIMEILRVEDLDRERQGEVVDGVRCFPVARPAVMLRILRNRFAGMEDIFMEIEKYTAVLERLGREFIAVSQEFIVDYTAAASGAGTLLLCGLQEYVDGEVLDPWSLPVHGYLPGLLRRLALTPEAREELLCQVEAAVGRFVMRIKRLISETGYIPDLAGIGNLILTPAGTIKLVDINNIMEIRMDDEIRIDDKGYPACDKSVEVLSLLEARVLGRTLNMDAPLYSLFLSPARQQQVRIREEAFRADLVLNWRGL